MNVPMNVNRFLNRTARLYAQKVAIIDGERQFTYREFYERVQRLSHALKRLGIQPGDRVATLAYNNYPLLEAYYGVVQFGAVLVPLNIRLTPADFAVIVADASPRLLLFDSDFEPVAKLLQSQHPEMAMIAIEIEGLAPGYRDYESWIAEEPSDYAGDDALDENRVAEIFYTSGTTGAPKGVALSHRNLYMHALQIGFSFEDVTDRMVLLHSIPLFHVNGWGTPHYVTAAGGTHVMMRRFLPATVFQLIERHRVTHADMVPTMVNGLLTSPDIGRYDLSSLVQLSVGGAPSPSSFVKASMDLLKVEYTTGYGLSESSPVVSLAQIKSTLATADQETQNRYRGWAGLPLVGVDVKLVNADGAELPWDGRSVGELLVRGDSVMVGYWNKPEDTEAAIGDGWLHTGDMALIDPEGYIKIVDRKKDIIISGGENISASELENVLYGHPAVLECCVVGKPHPIWGEVPHAVVVKKADQESVSADDLVAYVEERVAGFKAIKSVAFANDLPKTGTGKIIKEAIRAQFRSGIFDQ